MDAETWLLEPYLLKVSQLDWTLVRSTGGGVAALNNFQILEHRRRTEKSIDQDELAHCANARWRSQSVSRIERIVIQYMMF